MKLRNTSALIAALAMAAAIQTTRASLSLTLTEFEAGGTLTAGGLTFTGASYYPNPNPTLTSFDPNLISVDATVGSDGVVYLTWSGNIALSSSGTQIGDLKLQYIVNAGSTSIGMIDQAYTGSAQGGGVLAVDETVATGSFGGTVVASSHLTGFDQSDPIAEQNDNLYIIPSQSLLYVTKDISLSTIAGTPPAGELVTISQVSQSFHTVPEPTTVLAGVLLLLPFGASTLRIFRKKSAV